MLLGRLAAAAPPGLLPDLAALSSAGEGGGDAETDFWANMAHLQVHRRVRAMERLRLAAAALSASGLAAVALPLCQHALLEARSDKEGNLADAAVRCLAAAAARLRWGRYQALLSRYLGLLGERPEARVFFFDLTSMLQGPWRDAALALFGKV